MPIPVVLLLFLLSLAGASACTAQGGAPARGADVITESLIRRHVGVIAHDSMLGRDTPSRGLELTAGYVAAQFRRVGLEPGGDSGGFLQRYPIGKRVLDASRSWLRMTSGASVANMSFDSSARYMTGARSGRPITSPVVLLAGSLDTASIARANVAGQLVLLIGDFTKSLQQLNAILVSVLGRGPRAIVIVSNREPGRFRQLVRAQFSAEVGIRFETSDVPPTVEVHERALAAVLAAAGLNLEQLRGATAPIVQPLPNVQLTFTVTESTSGGVTAPNTVGILLGSDPVLRNEYLVFSAHMDHVGVDGSSKQDSIWNGADDDASGTAGVMALAEAFAKAPTKRSIIFLTVSGEEKGLWGSEWFAASSPVPVGMMVANLNLDMIGRNWKDTIVAIGKEHSDLGATLDRVNAAHPELGMSAIDDLWPQENFYGRSDHYNFAKRGVPILFFFNGTHADYHRPSDSPNKIDAEKEARIVKLIYFLGQEVGNAAEKPRWNPASYQKIVK